MIVILVWDINTNNTSIIREAANISIMKANLFPILKISQLNSKQRSLEKSIQAIYIFPLRNLKKKRNVSKAHRFNI